MGEIGFLSKDASTKVLFILATSIMSVLVQLNLRSTSGALPTSVDSLKSMEWAATFFLLMRVGLVSAFSMFINWYAYKKFGYLELLVAQSVMYFFAFATDIFILGQPFMWKKLLALLFIAAGVSIFNL